jgi:hypothetical protein
MLFSATAPFSPRSCVHLTGLELRGPAANYDCEFPWLALCRSLRVHRTLPAESFQRQRDQAACVKCKASGSKNLLLYTEPNYRFRVRRIHFAEARSFRKRNYSFPHIRLPQSRFSDEFVVNEKCQPAPRNFRKCPWSSEIGDPALHATRKRIDAPLLEPLWYWTSEKLIR